MLETTLIVCYLSILGLLAIYGFHRSMLVYLFFKTKEQLCHELERILDGNLLGFTGAHALAK